MTDNSKNIIVTISIMSVLIFILAINIIYPDTDISVSERRQLKQLSDIKIKNSNLAEEVDTYTTDQFALRDEFRKIKALTNFNIFRAKDNNDIFILDDNIYKIEYPLNENSVLNCANKINQIYDKYLKGMNVYYSIIPDKNYYIQDNSYLKLDYNKMISIMNENITNISYIDIFNELDKSSYYTTDTHWKQESLESVVNKIGSQMSFNKIDLSNYTVNEINNYYGVYYGQLGLDYEPDEITYFTNSEIEQSKVYNYEDNKYSKVYNLEKLSTSNDKYDIFLSGATPLIEITNPNNSTERELILFRDSFGSSIAPLLIDSYSKITLVDTRYMSSDLLDQFIDFKDQDVLFLYSTLIINSSSVLK